MSTEEQTRELLNKTRDRYQERKAEQEAFLEQVKEEDGAESISTHVTLVEGFDVDVTVTLDGELTDTLADIEERTERENPSAVDVRQTAREAADLLADAVDDPAYPFELFLDVYETEGLPALGTMLKRVLEGVKAERERQQGTAEGFRASE